MIFYTYQQIFLKAKKNIMPASKNIVLPGEKTSPENKLRSMRRLIELSGISHKELKRLKVIHISGTKGKGSTCAMIESIIRKSYSLKTGFYSSPHLISATERIRISGRPISQEKFSDYFWPLYNKLKDSKEDIFFFKILTVMALNVFIKEKVDIAIIEVGIGGTYDCTNIIDNPVACGITALGLDHTSLLGNTIQEIAWHKAGICKPNVPVFVNAYQAPEAMSVIKKIAKERGAPLYIAPEFSTYDWNSHSPLLGIDGHIQLQNAGLALQIAKYVLSLHEPQNFSPGKPFKLSCSDKEGLASCSWPGRFHRIQRNDQITLYLDAAHTKESIEACVDWYLKRNSRKKNTKRILLFNATRDHDSEAMLEIIKRKLSFDIVVFCTNVILPTHEISDNTYPDRVIQEMFKRCIIHKDYWLKTGKSVEDRVCVIPYIAHALLWITSGKDGHLSKKFGKEKVYFLDQTDYLLEMESCNDELEILITGSLHLVGDVMNACDVEL
ncbi:folylpolyglutamate synthase, mitochondrial isoform X2 [Lepeophtheirus salmonis]|uniref:folylpolyglutamate synthase, mitochondrial isoform X2 n=1 Tax=Lepeophtheirus salmonis TaxID=72036 RepID=UPI001AE2D863|nr:folylpolyglutamate synthase, mitochondrial-like isoform X3 [Lepeophtheirus salmonis]